MGERKIRSSVCDRMPGGEDHTLLSSQLEMVFKACDKDGKGFLTETDLNLALDQIMPQKDKVEILNILGVLNCLDARVSLPVFRQKVVRFLKRHSEEEVDVVGGDFENKENIGTYETFMSTYSKAHPQTINRRNTFSSLDDSINLKMSPFKPNLNSSFLICESAGNSPPQTPSLPLSCLSFKEDTFEGDGEDQDNPLNKTEDDENYGNYSRINRILQSRSQRFRKHLRSHKFSSSSSGYHSPRSTHHSPHKKVQNYYEEPDRINNNSIQRGELTPLAGKDQMENCLAWEKSLLNLKLQNEEEEKMRLQEENEALHRQLSQNEHVVKRFEDELSAEGKMVKALEEKNSFLDSNNKELAHDLENSKYNIKNLEDHLLFMEEKISNENKELNLQRYLLIQDKEHSNEEKIELEKKEKKVNDRLEEIEMKEDEILSEKHIFQQEITSLRRENRKLSDMNESLERSSQEELNKLRLANSALKETLAKLALKKTNFPEDEEELVKKENKSPHRSVFRKRSIIKYVVRRFCIHAALRSVYEIISYLVIDFYA